MIRFFKDLKNYWHYCWYSAKSSLKAEVANSYLNWVWWILNPLLFMCVYIFIGAFVYHQAEKSFAIYVFIGLTLWDYFNKTVVSCVKLVRNNKSVVTKIYLPKFILVLSRLLTNFIKMLFAFGIIIVLMIVYRLSPTWNILYLIPTLMALTLITFGASMIVMHFGVFIDDLHNIVRVAMRFLFYMTGIFYSLERLGEPWSRILTFYNPVAFCITTTREILIDGATPHYMYIGAWLVTGLLLSTLGVWLVYRHENTYVRII